MKNVTETTKAIEAYGKKLDSPIEYSFTFGKFESYAEVVTANELLSEAEVVKARNAKRKAKARAAALQAALDAAKIVRPTTENDPQLRLQKMADLYVQNGVSEEDARIKASEALGIAWEDDD